MRRDHFSDLSIAIRGLSETGFRRLSRSARAILVGSIRGDPVEKLEFQLEEILVDAEEALVRVPRAGSFIEWSLSNRIVWASQFNQTYFLAALVGSDQIQWWRAAEALAHEIYGAEIRLLRKLRLFDRFPCGLAAPIPHSASLFGRLKSRFVETLLEMGTGDVAMAGLLEHPENGPGMRLRIKFTNLLAASLRESPAFNSSHSGLECLRQWAQHDQAAYDFKTLIDFECASTEW